MYDDETEEGSSPQPRVPAGTYRARGVPGSAMLACKDGGSPYLVAEFEIRDPANPLFDGERVLWYGYFTEKTETRTLASLRLAGWSNDDIDSIEGFGEADVDIVVEHNHWKGKVSARVAWVNGAGQRLAVQNQMGNSERRSFAAKMKAKAVESRQGGAKRPTSAPKKNSTPHRAAAAGAGAAPADDDVGF